MIRRGEKSGQFYLLAAVLIIVLIIGFFVVQNYSSNKSSSEIYDLGKALKNEGQWIVQYGIVHDSEIDAIKENFSQSFYLYSNPGENRKMFFIFGDDKGITDVFLFQLVSLGEYGIGNQRFEIEEQKLEIRSGDEFCTKENEKVKCTFLGQEYPPFELSPGESFYFLISQSIEGEQYVTSG